MRHIENIVIGKPIVEVENLLSLNWMDWEGIEKEKTFFTEERNFAKILKELGIVSSTSEVRRNKPELCVPLTSLDCKEIKWGKNKFYVVIGE